MSEEGDLWAHDSIEVNLAFKGHVRGKKDTLPKVWHT